MTTHVLEGDGRTVIGHRRFTITVSGVREGTVDLEAFGPGGHPTAAVRPRPGRMVIDGIRERIEVCVSPRGTATFPDGTLLSVRLTTEPTAWEDGDQVVVQALEVSGRGRRTVVEIEPTNEQELVVTAVGAVVDQPIGPLGAAARAAARTRLGADRIEQPLDVRVVVDMSASMAPVFADGGVAAALEVIAGISQVIGAEPDLRVGLLTDHVVPLPPAPATTVASATAEQVERVGLGYGFRSAPPDLPGGPRTATYVLSDAVPADAAALRDARSAHLVVLGSGVSEPAHPDDPPTTVWPATPPGGRVADHLLSRPDLMAALVGSLTAAVPVAQGGTAGVRR